MSAPDGQEAELLAQVKSRDMAGLQSDASALPGNVRGSGAAFTRNSMLSVSRLFVTSAVALILPGYLTHKLPVATYAAWVLILQVSAYVNYLDFGIQAGISKFVAEYEARNDEDGASMRASAGLALMVLASMTGVVLTLILAWQIPRLFHDMPPALYGEARESVLLMGGSLSFNLLCSIFPAIFFGLRRFGAPTLLAVLNRLLFTAGVVIAAALHQSLAVMGGLVAVANVATGLLQFEAWRRMARHIRLRLRGLDLAVVRQMLGYGSVLAIWSAGMLCVSGLDVTIVGRYDFRETAFYSIATLPTNFLVSMVGAAMAPFMPTASALSVHRSPKEMGALLSRMTRYISILLILTGVPLLVGGYWILRLWLGPEYAMHTVGYLQILVLANIVRNLCMPYASMLIATDSQKIAIAGVIAEAGVNLASSIYLVQHLGAIGVAYGTLIGSFVSVGVHFTLNMHYTRAKFDISRIRLFMTGVVRPGLIGVPSLLLIHYWWRDSAPTLAYEVWLVWAVSSLLIAWFASLNGEERQGLVRIVDKKLKRLRAAGVFQSQIPS